MDIFEYIEVWIISSIALVYSSTLAILIGTLPIQNLHENSRFLFSLGKYWHFNWIAESSSEKNLKKKYKKILQTESSDTLIKVLKQSNQSLEEQTDKSEAM